MIITEYAEYGSLYNYLRIVGTLQFENIMHIMLSIVRGTAFLHRDTLKKPVITHRDLKSQNILIYNDMRCCISDFGLAYVFEDESIANSTGSNFQVSSLLCFFVLFYFVFKHTMNSCNTITMLHASRIYYTLNNFCASKQ